MSPAPISPPPVLRVPAIALIALAPLLPPEVDPWFAIALAAAAAAVALALVDPRAGDPGRWGLQLTALAAAPILAATWNSVDAGAARTRLVEVALVLVAFRGARDLLGERRREILATILAAVGGLTGAHAIFQRTVGFPRALETLSLLDVPEAGVYAGRLATGRVFSTFLLPSTFAGFLLLSLPVTGWMLSRVRGARRVAATVSAVMQLAALFLTYSQGAWVALAAALVAVGATAPSRRLRRGSLAAAAVAALLLAGVVALRGERLTGPEGRHNPLTERLGNWEVAAGQILDHPVTGVGPGGYGGAYTLYQRAGMNQSRYAHNSYLQVLAEGGLMMLPLLALLAAAVIRGALRPGRDAGERAFHLALLAALLHNLVEFTLFRPAVAIPFAAMLGAVASLPPGERTAPRTGRLAALLLAVGIPLATIPAALAAGSAAAARGLLVEGRPTESLDAMRTAARLDPWVAEYRDFLARWWLDHGDGDGDLARAREHAQEACRLARLTPHHRTTLALVCRAQGDPGCAWRSASRAASLFPASEDYRRRREALASALEGP